MIASQYKIWRQDRMFFFLLSVCIFLTTCKKENMCDCVKGTGKETTEDRTVSGFDQIYMQQKIDVHLSQGPEFKVRVEAGRHLIKLIKTDVVDGVLKISDHNKCDFTRSYKRKITVYVTMPVLKKAWNDGVGDLYFDNQFVCDTLHYYMSNSGNMHLNVNANVVFGGMHGNGDVYMTGIVGDNSMFAGGQGFFYAYDVVSNNVILTLKTSGQMQVNVNSGDLKVDMFTQSTGDVYYKGHPQRIYGTVSGSGHIVDKN